MYSGITERASQLSSIVKFSFGLEARKNIYLGVINSETYCSVSETRCVHLDLLVSELHLLGHL